MLNEGSSRLLRDTSFLKSTLIAEVPIIAIDDEGHASQVDSETGFPLTLEEIRDEYFPRDLGLFLAHGGLHSLARPLPPLGDLKKRVTTFLEKVFAIPSPERQTKVPSEVDDPEDLTETIRIAPVRNAIAQRIDHVDDPLRSTWGDILRLPPTLFRELIHEATSDEVLLKRENAMMSAEPIRVRLSRLVAEVLSSVTQAPLSFIQRQNPVVRHALLALASAMLFSTAGYGFFSPKSWDSVLDADQKKQLENLNDEDLLATCKNPLAALPTGCLTPQAAKDLLVDKAMSILFLQSQEKLARPNPVTLTDLTELLCASDESDLMTVLPPAFLPPDFWQLLDKEESDLIRRNVRAVVFAKDIGDLLPNPEVRRMGFYIGHGVIVIDSRLNFGGPLAYRLASLVVHESSHAATDATKQPNTTVPLLSDERVAYQNQAKFLYRQFSLASAENRTPIYNDYKMALRAAQSALFLEKHYRDAPPDHKIWWAHPGQGIQAAEFLRKGMEVNDLKAISNDYDHPDLVYEMTAAREALKEYERLLEEKRPLSDLLELARSYRDQHYQTRDLMDLLIADQLSGLYLHFYPDNYLEDLENDFAARLHGDQVHPRFQGGNLVSLRALQRVLPYDPNLVAAPQHSEGCTSISLEESIDEMVQDPSLVSALSHRLEFLLNQRYKTLKSLSEESSILYRLGYYYIHQKQFEQAERILAQYIDRDRNWHQDYETHVVMTRLSGYLSAHKVPPPKGTQWSTIVERHSKAAFNLDPGATQRLHAELFEANDRDGVFHAGRPFEYVPRDDIPEWINKWLCQ